jgi:predicted O-methyltransferase YrrM
MSERTPENLVMLHGAFGEAAIESILPGDSFRVDDVEFVCKYTAGSTADRFFIVKSLELVERYRQLCDAFHGGTIVELGIAEGGSTALLALWAKPRHLVAVDLEPSALSALDEFVDAHGLGAVVRPRYGIDQSDRAALAAAVDAEAGGAPLDLVIDDCSHQYGPTRSSFETLFPRLRPGGLYVIEDWNADHVMRDAVRNALRDPSLPHHDQSVRAFTAAMSAPGGGAAPARVPLTTLAAELLVARCSRTDAIAEVAFDEYWISVRRGEATLDADGFRLDDHVHDHFGFVPPH